MNKKHRKTLEEVFRNPVSGKIKWKDVEALFIALGAEIKEGRGSRVRVRLGSSATVFHRPHPKPETDKGALKGVRRFLEQEDIRP